MDVKSAYRDADTEFAGEVHAIAEQIARKLRIIWSYGLRNDVIANYPSEILALYYKGVGGKQKSTRRTVGTEFAGEG